MDDLLVLNEAAELLRVSGRSVRRWRDSGLLPCVRLGRRVFYRREVLEELKRNGLKLS